MRKQNKIEGQISFWEMTQSVEDKERVEILEQPEEKKTSEKVITMEQQSIVEKYKFMEELNRIIHYCGGGVGIELVCGNGFKTVYVNKAGEEEFIIPKETPVLPMDKIIFSKKDDYCINEMQDEKLQQLKEKYDLKSYIKRKGDRNVIILVNKKAISITTNGWILEFSEAIYKKNEIIEFETANVEYKVGDTVEAMWGKEKIVGKIFSKYEDKEAFNLIWENKHSAFHISSIVRKIA